MKARHKLGMRTFGVAMGAFLAVGATAVQASACGGEWYPALIEQVDHRPQAIAQAEKALDRGDLEGAAGFVLRAIPHIKTLKATKSPVVQRAHRVLAVVVARTDGALPVRYQVPSDVHGTWLGADMTERSENLVWAIDSLRAIDRKKDGDPAAQTDLGEALARSPEHATEGRELLEMLAKRDLLASPEAYAALAELRMEDGDAKGGQLAQNRCRAMAKSAGVCGEDLVNS